MYKKILVPLDGSVRAEKILSHVEHLALPNQSEVIFLQVVRPIVVSDGYKGILVDKSQQESRRSLDDSLEYLSGIEGKFRERSILTKKIVEIGSVVETIIQIAQQQNIDLIAMASHGRSGLARMFYGSVAAGLLKCIDRPLLLIRSRENEEDE